MKTGMLLLGMLVAFANQTPAPKASSNVRVVQPGPQTKWNVKKADSGFKEFDWEYSIPNCTILTRKDRTGLRALASTRLKDVNYHTNVEIQNRKLLRVSSFYFERDPLLRIGRLRSTKLYVFDSACRGALKDLPLHVRKLFFGYGDIQ